MTLGTDDVLSIGFDELSHTYHRYIYRLEHCEPDWTPSEGLFESDWLEGMNDNVIEDYQNSLNTTVLYTHYQLQIPNEHCRLKMSGNYRLTVIDEDAGDEEAVLVAEFRVVEPLMNIGITATTNTDIDVNRSHQQIGMTVSYGNLRVTNWEEQVKTVVMQNWREEDARWDVRPNYVNQQGLGWEHNRALIFEAGNEYRKFEVLDVSHPTMGIDRISWDGERYHAYPFVSTPRRNYLTDVDADGAFIIRNSDNTEIDYTCDYVWVHYQLLSPYVGDIYIEGHWTTDANPEAYKMTYDEESSTYQTTLMQKQGYYSYQYLLAGSDGRKRTAPTEGNFYQTENSYQALVYYRGMGDRTWRLVGYRGAVLR